MASSPFRLSPIQFSPFDLRFYLRIVAFLLAWKVLSTDYSALSILIQQGPEFYPYQLKFAQRLVHSYQHWLLDEPWKIVALQLIGAGFLLATCVFTRRWMLIAGVVAVLLIDWSACQYREHMWATQVPLSALLFFALWPVRWARTLVGDRVPTAAANALGRTVAVYFSWGYFFCGFSKLWFDVLWFKNFHNELFYVGRHMSKGPMPEWIDPLSSGMCDLFTRYPILSELSCFLAVVLELTWFTVLFSKWSRRTVPYLMVGTHIGFMVVAGFTFTTFVLSALCIVIPWRAIGRRNDNASDAMPSPRGVGWVGIAGMIVASIAAIVPAWKGRQPYPLSNFNVFGWSHKDSAGPKTWYYLGYADPRTGEVKRIPMYHAGFLDQELWFVNYHFQNYYSHSQPPAVKEASMRIIEQYARAIRPYESDAFLLGPLAMPNNVLSAADPVDLSQVRELYVVRYDFHYHERGLTPIITNLGPLPFPPPGR